MLMVALHGRRVAAGAAMATLPLRNMAVMAAAEVAVKAMRADRVRSVPMSVIILLKHPRPAPRCMSWNSVSASREPTRRVLLCRQRKDAGIALADDSSGFLPLPIAALRGCLRSTVCHRATPVPIYRGASRAPGLSSLLPSRPQRSHRGPFRTIYRIVDRVHRPLSSLYDLGRSCPLHRANRVHSPADASRHKQPGQEPHPGPPSQDDCKAAPSSIMETPEAPRPFTLSMKQPAPRRFTSTGVVYGVPAQF